MINSKLIEHPFYRNKFTSFLVIIIIGLANMTITSAWARNNCNQESQIRIYGKIVDLITNISIPFATISIYKGDSKIMTFFSDVKGEFSTDLKYLNTKVKISAIGYEEQTYYLANAKKNLVRLAPVNNILPNVTVTSKAPKKPKASINKIIKKVNKHFEQNYGNFSFDQTLKFYSTSHNYDSLKNEMTDLVVINFNKNQKTLTAKNGVKILCMMKLLFNVS
jgi:hypothetical protein